MIALHMNAICFDNKLIEVPHLDAKVFIELIAHCPNKSVLIQDILTNSLSKTKENFVIHI